jgi:hypothetical protein
VLTFKKHGFISLDYTYVPYKNTSYNFNQSIDVNDASYQSYINNVINTKYTGTSNVRLGGEYSIKDFKLRTGVAYYGSPYSSGYNPGGGYDQTEWLYTLGAGVRINHYYIDIAYAYTIYNDIDQPYLLYNAAVNPAQIKTNTSTIMCTFGIKF